MQQTEGRRVSGEGLLCGETVENGEKRKGEMSARQWNRMSTRRRKEA